MLQLNNMHRDYNSGHFGNEEVSVFTGLEIEHTLAYGKQTLFLATNNLNTDTILELAVLNNCEAIYYGANRTFQYNIESHVFQMKKLLDNGYYVTIDYTFADHEEVKKREVSSKRSDHGIRKTVGKEINNFDKLDYYVTIKQYAQRL